MSNIVSLDEVREAKDLAHGQACKVCAGAGFTLTDGKMADCPECAAKENQKRYETHALRSREGRIIDRDFISELGSTKVSSDYLRPAHSGKSCMMIGETGTGKSLALKYAHNRALKAHNGWPFKVFYAKEYHLFSIFRDDDKALEFFMDFEKRKPTHIFLDECFRTADWRDFHSDRDKAKLAHLNYYRFWDEYIYEAYWQVECVMLTGNAQPETVIAGTENEKALIRRIREMTKP